MVSIIGAGPVGNYLAGRLSEKGVDADVYEEHRKIGAPIACTGILTSYLKNLIKVHDEYVVNTINQTDVYSPDGNSVNIKLKKNYIVDRTLFDSHLADVAKSSGVKYHLNWKFTGLRKLTGTERKYRLLFQDGKKATDSCIIGADGPGSVVGRSAGIFGERKFVVGHQARVRMKSRIDASLVEFYLDKGNYIGWLVPESDRVARIGVASHKNVKGHFEDLIKKRPGKILGWQSGPIPVYNPGLKYEQDGIYLVGDAATQVKASTYGGIIPGMHAADVLVDVIHGNKPAGSYQKGLKGSIGKNLGAHLLVRKIMNRFTEKDYNELIRIVSQKKIRDLVYKHDREYPIKLLLLLALNEPRLVKFSKCLFKKDID
tara:strand:+ start:1405 stop:2520 length:1116 start_codon:yes stop_codon:yes gene_type:complete